MSKSTVRMRLHALGAVSVLAFAGVNPIAFAQDAAPADDETFALDTIVVTAQKRAEDTQDVPISLTAFGSEQLERRDIQDIEDLADYTPGFVSSSFSYGNPVLTVRGAQNTFSAAGAAKPIGVFIDEVYIPRFSASNFSLYDVESVSVLRGPQGTLFGRNVTSGAVLVQTRSPSLDATDLRFKVGIGNEGMYEAAGYVSAPISDTVAGSLSISRQTRDGYGKDIITGADVDDQDFWGGRAQFLFEPSDTFTFKLSADYSSDDNGGRALSALVNSDQDRRTTELGIPQTFEREIAGLTARADWKVGPATLSSITGYRTSDSFEIFSRTGLSYLSLSGGFQEIGEEDEDSSAFSEELRLTAETQDFDLVTGLYYFQENTTRGFNKYRLAAGSGAPILDQFYDQDVDVTSWAPFADATWHATPRLDLTAGVRYSYEKKDAELRLTDSLVSANDFTGKGTDDWSEVTYRAVATYHPVDDVTLYASYATGFTAGGFNTEADKLAAFNETFDPETSESFEVGVKSLLAGGRARLNVTAFSTKYDDKQEFVFNRETFIGNIVNAAEASIQGVEADFGVALNSVLDLTGTFAYMDSEYEDFDIPGDVSRDGNELTSAPEFAYSLALDLNQPFSWGNLIAGTSYAYRDSYYPSSTNTSTIPSRGLVDAQIGVESPDGRWRLTLWGRNLTDEEYPLITSDFIVDSEWLAPPRTYGLRLSFQQ